MKLSMDGGALRSRFGEKKALRLIKDAGFDSVDYSFYWAEPGFLMASDNYRSYAQSLRNYLDEIGLSCNQAHAPFEMAYGHPFDTSDEGYLNVVRAIESAAILGAEQIIVHALPMPEDTGEADFMAYNLAYYESLEPYAQKSGIKIAVENLFGYDEKRKCHKGVLGRPEQHLQMMDMLNPDVFTVCVDVGHASLTGYEPQNYIRYFSGKQLTALHIQDTDYLFDRHVLPFTGEFDWTAICEALNEIGYQGDLTFEVFSFINKFPDELIPDVLSFCATVGRFLIGKIRQGSGIHA